jgi:DNA-binding PadR family transcriptional regulator
LRSTIGRPERPSPIQLLILLQLTRGPRYGYELLKELREGFGDVWEARTGTIYPALRGLKMRGLIESVKREGKEFYRLTERGEEFLKRGEERLERGLSFIARYLAFMAKLMPPEAKVRILEKMVSFTSEGLKRTFLEGFLEGVEKERRIEVLRNLKQLLSKRIRRIEEMINQEEGRCPRSSELRAS